MLLSAALFLGATLATAQCQYSDIISRPRFPGDECPGASEGSSKWVCEIITNCPAAMKLLKANKRPPRDRWCGFNGSTPQVCCPPYDISDWTQGKPSKPDPEPLPIDISSVTEPPSPSSDGPGGQKASAMCRTYYPELDEEEGVSNHSCAKQSDPLVEGAQQFPHMALIGFGTDPTEYVCGGALISDRFVLTAAHCEKHPDYGFAEKVRLREVVRSTVDTETNSIKVYDVARRIVHPKYKHDSHYNDIMLLQLAKKVKFDRSARPICLHDTQDIDSKRAIVTGWNTPYDLNVYPNLVELEIPFADQTKCYAAFFDDVGTPELKTGIDEKTQLCVGAEVGKDTCHGDSGGPLQIRLKNCIFSQVGVSSFGDCGSERIAGVYTRISAFLPWIEAIVWP